MAEAVQPPKTAFSFRNGRSQIAVATTRWSGIDCIGPRVYSGSKRLMVRPLISSVKPPISAPRGPSMLVLLWAHL